MLTKRSMEKELIDLGPDYYTQDEYVHCMQQLFRINKLLGFFHSTVKILKLFAEDSSLLDIGCGDGLFILNLNKHFPQMKMIGTDISVAAIDQAKTSLKNFQLSNSDIPVSFQLQEQVKLNFPKNSYDIILTTLVCHHLTDEELIPFLQNALETARQAVIINDLHRHTLAYGLYRIVSPFFRNRLITNDGLISIRRSYKRSDWQRLLAQAGITHYQLKWCFPFRWQLILWK